MKMDTLKQLYKLGTQARIGMEQKRSVHPADEIRSLLEQGGPIEENPLFNLIKEIGFAGLAAFNHFAHKTGEDTSGGIDPEVSPETDASTDANVLDIDRDNPHLGSNRQES